MTAPDLSPAEQAFLARPAVDAAEDARVDAAKAAVRDMPADWYCPADGSRQRILCPECIAEVAAVAASAAAGTDETQAASGADLIAAERRRQIEAEGWTPEHDAEHGGESLAIAACTRDNGGGR